MDEGGPIGRAFCVKHVVSTLRRFDLIYNTGSGYCVYQKEGNGVFHTTLRSRWYNL